MTAAAAALAIAPPVAAGPLPNAPTTGGVVPDNGAGYVPIVACRVLDTRRGDGAFADGDLRAVQVTGSGSVFTEQGGSVGGCAVPAGATAVAASITAVDPGGDGYLRAWPKGDTAPTATVVNFNARRSTTNSTTVTLSDRGALALESHGGTTDYVIDVQGYFSATSIYTEAPVPESVYVAVQPCRVVDTRAGTGTPLTGGERQEFQVAGTGDGFVEQGGRDQGCAVPAGATAVQASFSAVAPGRTGFIRSWPAGAAPPNATILNFNQAEATTNTVAVTLGTGQTRDLAVAALGGTTDLVIDVQGYYADPATVPFGVGARYHPLLPCRVVDTRTSGRSAPTSGERRTAQIAGTGPAFVAQGGQPDGCGVPAGAAAVEASLSIVDPARAGFTRVWPAGTPAPTATVANVAPGRSTTNSGPLTIGSGTDLAVATYGTAAHRTIDISGYYQVPTVTRLPPGDAANFYPSISDDGRFIVFNARGVDYRTDQLDVHLWDRSTGMTSRITAGDHSSTDPEISGDGRFITFTSGATNLIPGQTNTGSNVFLLDRSTGSTTRITSDGRSSRSSISRDGGAVAYQSNATGPVQAYGVANIYVWNRSGTTLQVTDGDEDSTDASISADGNTVTFSSLANGLAPGASDTGFGIYLWDRDTGGIVVVDSDVASFAVPQVDASGSTITYTRRNPVSTLGSDAQQVVVWDRASRSVTAINDWRGETSHPVISSDGQSIAFRASSDEPAQQGMFLWRRADGATTQITSSGSGETPTIDADGHFVAYETGLSSSEPGQHVGIYLYAAF